MEVKLFDKTGKQTAKAVKLNEAVFGITPNDHAIYLDVKQHNAAGRQGTAKSKERAEIKGSTRKIKKQKGTGTARAGSIKNPLFRGGGRVFGPQPRDYDFKLNKKVKHVARKSALSYKVQDNDLMVIEDFSYDLPKTKQFIQLLENMEVLDKKTVIVLNESNKNVYLSSRNLQRTKVVTTSELSTYTVLNAGKLILSEGAVKQIEESLS